MTISGEIQRPWVRHYDPRGLVRSCKVAYFHIAVSLSALYIFPVVIKKTRKQRKRQKQPRQHGGPVSFLRVRQQSEELPSKRQD